MMRSLNFLIFTLTLASCGVGVDEVAHNGVCDGYTDSQNSDYVLPYPAGMTFEVSQGNCSAVSHRGEQRYAYDFAMDIGSDIAAIREGVVTKVEESNEDGNGCSSGDNHIHIKHSDGSEAIYVHLTLNGALAEVGDTVAQGEVIAKSGNTGCSSGAHLHLQVELGGSSIPLTFSNAQANPRGLVSGQSYAAQ